MKRKQLTCKCGAWSGATNGGTFLIKPPCSCVDIVYVIYPDKYRLEIPLVETKRPARRGGK